MPLGLDFIEQIRRNAPFTAIQFEDWAARLAPIVPIIDSMSALATGYLKVTTTANVTTISSVTGVPAVDVTTGTIAAARFPAFTGDVTTAAGSVNTVIGPGKVTNAMLAWAVVTGRVTARTAAVASIATATVGAADGSFHVSANVLVTVSTLHNFTMTVSYTDEGGTPRVATLNFSTLAGVLAPAITNTSGAGPYEGVPLHIRAQAASVITIGTTGTLTTVTYNAEGIIAQVA